MNDKFSSAGIKINVDVKDANRELGNVSSATEKALNSMRLSADSFTDKWGDLTKGIKDTKRIVSGIMISQAFYTISVSATLAASSALEFSKNMETAAISMEYFVEGANKAAKAQAFLREMNTFAARTPFGTEEAISLSKYMQAVGVSMGTTKSFLKTITDTAAATGATEQNLQRITFALGQMMTKGRIANEEIRQLANANIPIYEILQEQLGLTGEQISNIGSHWIDADKAVVAILSGLEQRYAGAADRVSDSFTGMVDTVKDNSLIISQIAASGVYESLAGNLTNVRDALDRYREIATVRGSTGLFTQVLLDLDSTGKLGAQILSLVGNAKQLTASLRSLYITAAPIRTLFGDTIYASISAVTIGLTGMTHAANQLLQGLGLLSDLTGGKLAHGLASLFITYKAASWMALLGQMAIKGAYGIYQVYAAAKGAGIAFMGMNTGVLAAVGGLATLVAYLIAARSLLGGLSSSMAGLNSSTSGGNLLPDDYMSEFVEYEAKMAEYNAAVAKYQEDFNKPFTDIDDGSDAAKDAFGDVADASKKAAKSVKNDWTAAFDEVYTIPKDSDAGGGGKLDDLLFPDLGASLIPPIIKFPDIKSIPLEMPKMNWKDVFSGSPMESFNFDSGVFDTKWWEKWLPAAVTFAVVKAGLGFAKARVADPFDPFGKDKGGGGAGGGVPGGIGNAALHTAEENRKLLSKIVAELTNIEKQVAGVIKQILAGEDKYELLEQLTKLGNSALDNIHKVQVVLGNEAKQITAASIDQANRMLGMHKMARDTNRYLELLADSTRTDAVGDINRSEIKALHKTINNNYSDWLTKYGNDPQMDELVSSVAKIKGLDGRLDDLINGTKNISKLIETNNGSTVAYAKEIKDLTSLMRSVDKELAALGITDEAVEIITKKLTSIDKLLKTELKLAGLDATIISLKDMIDTAGARKVAGQTINYSKLIDDYDNAIVSRAELAATIDNLRSMASGDQATFKVVQTVIDANHELMSVTQKIVRQLGEIAPAIKSIDKYSKNLLYTTTEGKAVIKNGLYQLHVDTTGLKETYRTTVDTVFNSMLEELKKAATNSVKPKNLENMLTKGLSDAIETIGKQLNTTTSTITTQIAEITKAIGKASGFDPGIEAAIIELKHIKDATKASAKATKVVSNVLEAFEESAYALQKQIETDFSKIDRGSSDPDHLINQNLKTFDKGIEKLRKEFLKLYPTDMAALEADILEEIVATRTDVIANLEKLQGQANLRNSGRDKIIVGLSSENVDLIEGIAGRLGILDESMQRIGNGLRQKDAWLPLNSGSKDPLEKFARNIEAGFIDSNVATAQVFDALRAVLASGNVGGMLGQDNYGNTVFSALISDLSKAAKKVSGIPTQLNTLISIGNFAMGRIAEIPILASAMEKLASQGLRVSFGDTIFNETRTLQAQLDGVITRHGKFVSTIDAKALFATDKINYLINNFGSYEKGIYTLQAKVFNEVISKMSSIGWQLATQAAITGKTHAYLAVLDNKLAGLTGIDVSAIGGLNPANDEDIKLINKIFEKQAYDQVANALRLNTLNDNIKIIRIGIPKWAKEQALELGQMYKIAVAEISKQVSEGASLRDLLTAQNALGEKIGILGSARYDSKSFKPPALGDEAANSMLRGIIANWKSGNEQLISQADVVFQSMIDKLNAVLVDGKSETSMRTVDFGMTNTGLHAEISKSGVELVKIRDNLLVFKETYVTRNAALTKVLSDRITQLNTLVKENTDLRLDSVIGKNAKGTEETIKDLLMSIRNTDISVTGGSTIQQAISSMLSGRAPVAMDNPYSFASLAQFLDSLGAAAKLPEMQVLASNETSGIIQQFVKLKDIFANIVKETTYLIDGVALRAKGFGLGKFSVGKVTPGMPAGAEGAAQYVDDAAKYFVSFGKNVFKITDEAAKFQKTMFVATDTVSKAVSVLNTAGQGLKIGVNIADIYKTDAAYKELVSNSPDMQPYGNPKNLVDDIASTFSWFDALGTRSGPANTLKDYFSMGEEDKMFWGNKYITNDDWRKGMLSGSLLGRGEYDQTMSETVLSKKPGVFGGKIRDDEAGEYLKSQLGSGSPFDAVVDYIVRSGDTTSATAELFYDKYGMYLDDVVKPAYGMDVEWNKAVELLMAGAGDEINSLLEDAGMGRLEKGVPVDIAMKPIFDSIIASLQEQAQTLVLAELDIQREHNTMTSNPIEGDWSRIFSGSIDTASLTAPVFDELANTLGISLQQINDQFSKLNIDSELINDNILGWTQRLPESMQLDLSPNEVQILATAGIQVNGDGTITFMKAMNANTSGTERTMGLTISDVAGSVIEKLNKSGLSFDFSGSETSLDLSLTEVSKKMQSAMFKLNANLSGQVSEDMEGALKGLGSILDSGYFRITNKAVLSGDTTIAEYIASMGDAAKRLSPEVLEALKNIDNVIAQGGKATQQSVAEWADGISMPSPIKAEELTPEIEAAFAAIGITFAKEGNNFMMVVNRLSENLQDGVTLIPESTWNTLNEGVVTALRALGVTITTEAGFVKVDLSTVLKDLISAEDITPGITTAMEKLGVTFVFEGGKLVGIANKAGEEIASGMLTLPMALWEKVDPAVRTALNDLGVSIQEEGGKVMVDFTGLFDNGVNDVIKMFVEQPELWGQIPQQVIDTLAAAGLATENGMLVINTNTLNGMVELGGTWFQYWDQLDDDVIKAMGLSHLATQDGLISIEKLTEDTIIPKNLDEYVIKPFDELPKEIQDRLTGGDESVAGALKGSQVLIKGATQTAFAGMITAIRESMGAGIVEAEEGAKAIGEAVATALRDVAKMNNVTVKKQGYISTVVGSKSPTMVKQKDGTWTVTGGGYTYKGIVAKTGFEANKIANQRAAEGGLPAFKEGGLISSDGTYRAGEFGRLEAVLPLENPKAMQKVGMAIAAASPMSSGTSVNPEMLTTLRALTTMTKDITAPLQRAVGLVNAGVQTIRKQANTTAHYNESSTSEDRIAKRVIEAVLPTLVNRNGDTDKRPLYVGTLIADQHGLKELNRQMRVIDLQEGTRRA